MLHHEALSQQLHDMTVKYQHAREFEYERAHTLWSLLCDDARLCTKIQSIGYSFSLPVWDGPLAMATLVKYSKADYTVIGVDGSQIYPDRHQGVACYVINIGTVVMWYGVTSGARLISKPTLLFEQKFFDAKNDRHDYCASTADEVNCQRTEFEFQAGLDEARYYKQKKGHEPLLVLFDGSLIFWHLEHKDETTKRYFSSRYIGLMQEFCREQIVYASYISLPKSRELVHALCAAACLPEYGGIQENFTCLIDADVMTFCLQPHERSTIFMHNDYFLEQHDVLTHPYFFYLHNGTEIVRIEIPAWIAAKQALVDEVAMLVLSQSIKGNGYPVCLAEAHEQAVVNNADREVFYHFLEKIMIVQNGRTIRSQKSVHKRFLGI